MRTLWTIGHGAHPIDELIEKLVEHRIDRLVDVRTKPYSRWHSQFNREYLSWFLAESDINYDWRGLNLGGLAKNILFDETLAQIGEIAQDERIALLCSESAPEKCHRATVLAPAFEGLGYRVVHIRYGLEP